MTDTIVAMVVAGTVLWGLKVVAGLLWDGVVARLRRELVAAEARPRATRERITKVPRDPSVAVPAGQRSSREPPP